jgi:hypothetical protein
LERDITKIKDIHNQKEDQCKTLDLAKGKTPESAHYIVSHCNIGVTEDLYNTSFASWRGAWLLDTGATCHDLLEGLLQRFQ